jgi:WD40 repeat protein/class 3 adenylate cyclase
VRFRLDPGPKEAQYPSVAERTAGIKTFLIADVRGYTAFTNERGDEAAARLAKRFADVARLKVEGRGGELIELRGDEALAGFDSARDAIRAAIDLQLQFVEDTVADPTLPLAVGIGLDAGEAVPVDGGFRGGALNLAARLCSIAGPGEVLASREVAHLARKIDGIAYLDHGAVRLKGLEGEVAVVAVRPALEDLAANVAFLRALGPAGARVDGGVATRNPYKGLRAFEEADADDFFGREALTQILVERLSSTRFLAVVGPSGSGKSSVVRAGLVPALRRGALPGSETWHVVQIFPGAHPLEELEAGLLKVAANPPPSLMEQLTDGRRGLPRALKRSLPEDDSELVLVVDQLEEVFTLVDDEDRRVQFLELIEEAVADPSGRLRVVTTLRADFYDRPLLYSGFAELLRDYVEAVVPLTADEFERAITAPAASVGVAFEPGLFAEVVADVANEPGSLPLLQYALTELYERREGNVLTREAYRAIGGVSGALTGRAEEIYAELDDAAREPARQLFLRLVAVGEGTDDTRRRVDRAELASIEVDQSALTRAVDAFGRSRLLSFDRDPRTGSPTIEVAHEALLREWARLRAWIDAAREDVLMHRRLVRAAREWAEAERDPSFLLRGSNLAQFEGWSERSGLALAELERDFVNTSRAESRRELQRQQRQNRRLKFLLAGVGVLLFAAIAGGIVAFLQRQSAKHQATVALARGLGSQAIIEPRVDRAMLLANTAVELDRSADTEGALLSTLLRSPAVIGTATLPLDVRPCCGMTLSPDGRTLAMSDNGNHVRLVDTASLRIRRVIDEFGQSQPVAYSRDGSVLVDYGGSREPEIRVVDARTLKVRRTLRPSRQWFSGPSESPLRPLLVTPDGREVLLVYSMLQSDGSPGQAFVDRWNLRTGKFIASIPLGFDGARAAELIASGRQLAVAGASGLTVFDTKAYRALRSVPLPEGLIVAINGDGSRAAIGTDTGAVSFVDLKSGRVEPAGGALGSGVIRAEFSRDARTLATTALDGSVVVWDARTGSQLEHLTGHAARPLGIAFGDGSTLYTSSLDGALFGWDLGTRRRFGVPFAPAAPPSTTGVDVPEVPPLALAPDGKRFAARIGGRRVGIYSTEEGKLLRSFPVSFHGDVRIGLDILGSATDIHALAWSPTGDALVTAGSSGQLELWNVAGEARRIRTLSGLRSTNDYPEAVQTVAFSPDGGFVVAADMNHTPGANPRIGRLAAWRTRSGKPLWQPIALGGSAAAVALSPDGKRAAVGLDDGAGVQLVDIERGKVERTIRPTGDPRASISAIAFSPSGLLATGSDGGIVQLWDPASGGEIGHATLVAAAPVASIDFAPSGEMFATAGGSDGLVKLWSTGTQQQFGSTFAGPPGTFGNARFTPDGSKLVVVYGDGSGFVWATSIDAWRRHACHVAGRNLTREEWSRYVGSRSYTAVCADFPSGRR